MSVAVIPKRSWQQKYAQARIFDFLHDHSDEWGRVTVPHSEIADAVGCSTRQVIRRLKRLATAGQTAKAELCFRVTRACKRQGNHVGNSYVVHAKREAAIKATVARAVNGNKPRSALKNPAHVTPLTPVYSKSLSRPTHDGPVGENGGQWPIPSKHQTMERVRKAVNHNGFLSNDQKRNLIQYIGHVVWKRPISPHQRLQLGGWVELAAKGWRTTCDGRSLARWFHRQIRWLEYEKRGRKRDVDRKQRQEATDRYKSGQVELRLLASRPWKDLHREIAELRASLDDSSPELTQPADGERWKRDYLREMSASIKRQFEAEMAEVGAT